MPPTILDKRVLFIGYGPIIHSYLKTRQFNSYRVVSNIQGGQNSEFIYSYQDSANLNFLDHEYVVISTRLDKVTQDLEKNFYSLIKQLEKNMGLKKVIVLSSVSVYGNTDRKCDESAPTIGDSMYAQAKLKVEQLINESFPIENVTVLRISNVFGDLLFKDVINNFVAGIIKSRKIDLPIEDNYRDFIHICDLFDMFDFFLTTTISLPNLINVGSGKSYSIYELAEYVAGYFEEELGKVCKDKNLVFRHKSSIVDTTLLKSLYPSKHEDFYLQLPQYLDYLRDCLSKKRNYDHF